MAKEIIVDSADRENILTAVSELKQAEEALARKRAELEGLTSEIELAEKERDAAREEIFQAMVLFVEKSAA